MASSTAPLDYISQRDRLSPPVYPKTVTTTETVTASDGEQLYVEITRPDPAEYPDVGPVPVILEASPYHGTLATRIGDRIFPDPKQGGKALGLTGYFAPRGYAVAMMDLRGTGRSTGCLDHLGAKDAADLKATVEWLADQTWSNGRVGMTGHSYVGSTPNVAAAMKPRGLVTIVPSAGLASMYDHQFNKGVPWLLQWVGPMVAYEELALVRDLPPGFTEPVLTGSGTGDNWDGGPNPQTGCGMQNSALTAGSGQVTGQYEPWHAARDWRAQAAEADIPIFLVHGTNDNAARIPAAEWFFANRYLRAGDKVWIGRWNHGSGDLSSCSTQSGKRVSHPNCRFAQWQYALHAWFDHHLQQRTWTDAAGQEHPIDTGPAVEAFLNGTDAVDDQALSYPGNIGQQVFTADAWRDYPRIEAWPDAVDKTLQFSEPAASGQASFGPTANAAIAYLNVPGVEFQSDPVTQDSLFVGLPRLTLNASVSNSQVAHLTATLYREDPNGDREEMSHCAINPLVRDDLQTLSPVVPGDEMQLEMQCFTMAHWVPAGQSLVLKFSHTTDHHASYGADTRITIHTGPGKTRAELPSVPEFTLHHDVPLEP